MGVFRDEVVNVLDSDVVVRSNSSRTIALIFWLIPLRTLWTLWFPRYGLNSIPTVLSIDLSILTFDECPTKWTNVAQGLFFKWIRAQARGPDTFGGSKNTSGPVGIPLKKGVPQAPGDKPNSSWRRVKACGNGTLRLEELTVWYGCQTVRWKTSAWSRHFSVLTVLTKHDVFYPYEIPESHVVRATRQHIFSSPRNDLIRKMNVKSHYGDVEASGLSTL